MVFVAGHLLAVLLLHRLAVEVPGPVAERVLEALVTLALVASLLELLARQRDALKPNDIRDRSDVIHIIVTSPIAHEIRLTKRQ